MIFVIDSMDELKPVADPIKHFIFANKEFSFFSVKLSHFIIKDFFFYLLQTYIKSENNEKKVL